MIKKNYNPYRNLRVAKSIQDSLNEILLLGRIESRGINIANCCVTKLNVSRDLKLVTCYFVPCSGSYVSVKDLLQALNDTKSIVRKMLSSKVSLKYAPEIRYIHDTTFDEIAKVNSLIDQIANRYS